MQKWALCAKRGGTAGMISLLSRHMTGMGFFYPDVKENMHENSV